MNMREQYIGVLVVFAVLLLVCFIRSFAHKGIIARDVRCLLITIEIELIGHVLIASAASKALSGLGYYGYLIGSDWMFFFGVCFMIDFCHYEEKLGRLRKAGCIIIAADTLSMLINPFLQHVFTLKETLLSDDDKIYYKLSSNIGHYAHLSITYLFFAGMLVMVIVKAAKTPKIYFEKYIVIILSLIITAVWETMYVFMNKPIDKSMTGYGLCGVLIFYFSLEYTPIFILRQMLIRVVNNVSESIFFFDQDNTCMFVNEKAKENFGVDVNDKEVVREIIGGFLGDFDFATGESFEKRVSFPEKDKYYIVEFHRLENKKKKFLSSFVTIRDVSLEERKQREKRYLATHDSLTGLYNREYFLECVEKKLRENPDEQYCMVSSNYKNFKFLNDIYGRDYCDGLLLLLADKIMAKASLDSLYARLNNDKFAMLINRRDFNEEILLEEAPVEAAATGERYYPIILHVGVYNIVNRDMPVSTMLDRTYMAIDSIKDSFSVRIAYYDESLRNERIWEQYVSGALEGALEKGEIVPFLQPQVDFTGKCIGAEMLMRWNHPTEGFLSPARFIPIIEKNGLIAKADAYMWEQAVKLLAGWKEKGVDDLNVSVNISPRDLYFMDVAEVIDGLVKKYGVEPKKLHLEITESVMMENEQLGIQTISKLRELGFVVEMDDFGSGYSSLNMLKDMPIDMLKVDMVFLTKTSEKKKAETIIRSVIELSGRLGIGALTEGVETKEQLDMLSEMGCRLFQGYYFAKPMPVDEFVEKYVNKTA